MKAIQWIGKENGYLKLIDQTQLPDRLSYLIYRDSKSVYEAIKCLKIRGAPLIGITAAFGLYLGIRDISDTNYSNFTKRLNQIKDYLLSARPTAVNLAWALERMIKVIDLKDQTSLSLKELRKRLLQEAIKILQEDREICQQIGQYGARLIKNGVGVLTYCNTGFLATGGNGTAMAVIYQAKKEGKKFQVYVAETRPLLQGARLSTWELLRARIKPILVCDNMIGDLMAKKRIQLVLVGADRIAANGDTANKIGTYSLALLAHYHQIPFYVVAPLSTFDRNLSNGSQIPIEHRHSDEITTIKGVRIAPRKVKVYNPSFDITPARFITNFITEKGILNHSNFKHVI